MKSISLTDDPIAIRGAIDTKQSSQGLIFWRLPAAQADLFHPQLCERAQAASGVRLTFRSNTTCVQLAGKLIGAQNTGPKFDGNFDLLVDGQLHQRRNANATSWPLTFDNLPEGEHLLELYLPQLPVFAFTSLAIDDNATILPDDRTQPRWIAYGSSITHCGAAAGPSETWPALVARQFDFDLMSMGFGGQCHLDGMVARTIRDQPADIISLCLGINVQGSSSLGPRAFRESAISFVKTVRDGHPDAPISIMSPIFSYQRETEPNIVNFTLPMMREMLEETVNLLRKHGDEKLVYVNGLDILGEADADRLADQLHPDAEGYALMAQRFGEKVVPQLLQMQ